MKILEHKKKCFLRFCSRLDQNELYKKCIEFFFRFLKILLKRRYTKNFLKIGAKLNFENLFNFEKSLSSRNMKILLNEKNWETVFSCFRTFVHLLGNCNHFSSKLLFILKSLAEGGLDCV